MSSKVREYKAFIGFNAGGVEYNPATGTNDLIKDGITGIITSVENKVNHYANKFPIIVRIPEPDFENAVVIDLTKGN